MADSYHYHEVMDRAHTLDVLFDALFEEHPVFHEHEELKKLRDELGEKIAEFYQKCGENVL